MYKRFTPQEDLSNFDYVVVGSGIGGLSAAVFLGKAGKKVLVLERHYVPGGFSHTFKRNNGFRWDVGVHYVGNMDEDTSFLRKTFDYLTDNKLKWASMGEVYDEVNIGSDKFKFVAGEEKLKTSLKGYFPDDAVAIDKYFETLKKAVRYGGLFFIQKSFPLILQVTLGVLFRKMFYRYSSRTTYDVLKSITSNEKLISVLCSQCGNYGLPPGKSSFGAHAIVITHFLEGGYYPVGGAEQISKTLIECLHKHNGEIRIHADVQEIVVSKGSTTGVRVNNTFIPCKNIISNVGIRNTYTNLLKAPMLSIMTDLVKVKPSSGHLCLYLGLDLSDHELQLPKHNVWFYDSADIDSIADESNVNSPLRFAYISFPSAKDPSWTTEKPTQATIQAIGIADYSSFEEFENERWMKRGDGYNKLKEDFRDKMLAKLYELYPQIKGHVVHAEVSSPLSTRHFTNYQHGEIYGLEHSPARFKLKGLTPKTSIKGLYLTGQDIVTVGVGGALASGLLCATTILKFGIAKQFKAIGRI